MATVTAPPRCPCLSGETYEACCAPAHRGATPAPTATRAMRARYSAFAVSDRDYLLQTWHPATRPATLELDDRLRWFRLDILGSTGGGLLDSDGTVEFEAHYRSETAVSTLHELSRFTRVAGLWTYIDGS